MNTSYPLPFLYHSPYFQGKHPEYAVIVLPEIFGLNAHCEIVADRFCEVFTLPSFGLDVFYALTEQHNDFAYNDEGVHRGIELMNAMTGDHFLELFGEAKNKVKEMYPSVKHFIVTGFCFGGRLAMLAGSDEEVSHVISFYGARSDTPLEGGVLSPVKYLAARNAAPLPHVIGLFGKRDDSIPASVRASISDTLEEAGVDYTESLYDAGHAFFNSHRSTYVADAAREAWADVRSWLRERM